MQLMPRMCSMQAGQTSSQRLCSTSTASRSRPDVLVRTSRRPSFRGSPLICRNSTNQQPLKISSDGLSIFQNTQPVDRLRYQARYIFNHFDADKDGVLNALELQQFQKYISDKTTTASEFAAKVSELNSTLSSHLNGTAPPSCSFDKFVGVIRTQVNLASEIPDVLTTEYSTAQLTQIGWKNGLSTKEMASAFWTFSLLDFNGDGYVSWEELQSMPGLEGDIVRQKLGDDEDDAAPVAFDKYLSTYAKPRPMGLNVCLMVAHSGIIWTIFNSPMSEMIKLAFTAFVVLQPHLITKPVVKIYNIVSTLFQTVMVRTRMARQDAKFA